MLCLKIDADGLRKCYTQTDTHLSNIIIVFLGVVQQQAGEMEEAGRSQSTDDI